MMLGDGAAVAESGGASGGSSEVGVVPGGVGMEESGGGGGGNRWPRQETLALLKIRSDMDVAFKDASLKGPLWDEVSRKMGELGFQRSAKKCKEKFENVYKYHKRTKDGRASKPDGKTYRFFDQLAALETAPFNHQFTPPPPPPPRPHPPAATPPPLNTAMPTSHVTVSSTTSPTPLSVAPPKIVANRVINSSSSQPPLVQPAVAATFPRSGLSNSTSSSTSSDEDIHRRRGRKRKWKDYFEKLLKDVVEKQEELQKKFLETLEKRERERIVREEAWRVQEMARLNREHDRLVQERSISAAKDAAVIAFLQKVTGENADLQIPVTNSAAPREIPVVQPAPPPLPPPPTAVEPVVPLQHIVAVPQIKAVEFPLQRDGSGGGGGGGGDGDLISPSSSRWPKAEVEALIKLRTGLELKYQDNGPKGPLWEEISKAMASHGYNRNAKRCKEKWENINKYFKKVKESSKKRPEDSKTCPYFHQLDAIYKERAKNHIGYSVKPESPMVAIMARPEQQWPQTEPNRALDIDNEKNDDHEDEYEDDDEDDDEVGGYEIIANKQVE